jgi:CDP-paratose synthetase
MIDLIFLLKEWKSFFVRLDEKRSIGLRILLTGGSGFLGSALAVHLQHKGYAVALLLRKSSRLNRLSGMVNDFDIGRFKTDNEITEFIHYFRPDVVIHTACSYGRGGESLVELTDVNIRYGLLIMSAMLNLQKPVTFINTGTILASEVNAYALTKNQFTQSGRFLAVESNGQVRFINVLLQHMYGPGDDSSKFISYVLQACKSNEPVLKLTAGDQQRDFIFIEDVVSAYSTLIEQAEKIESVVDIEVGSGSAPSIKSVVKSIHRLTKSITKLDFGALPYRNNETMLSVADTTMMERLGWRPKYDIQAGLMRTIKAE